MLSHILPDHVKNDRTLDWASKGKIIKVDQDGPSSMDQNAFVYVPNGCVDGGCNLHVAFHGCGQEKQFLNEDYAQNTGYLEWAATNDLIVLFPQAVSAPFVNESGCWDFWGLTNENYATHQGE